MQHGDILFRQGQATSGLYRVDIGSVTLRRTSQDGDTLTLHCATSGGYFAEASIFSEVYHCDAICTIAGSVTKIAKADTLKIMQSDPVFSAGFLRLLATQVQQYRAQIEILGIRSAKERVLAAIQAGYYDATITELASRIQLTHEACYRAFGTLVQEGRMAKIGRGQYALI